MLWIGGGAASALRNAAGPAIEAEAASHAPAKLGTVVTTSAGNHNKAKLVFHAVVAGQDLVTRHDAVAQALEQTLAQANRNACHTLALPMLVTEHLDDEIHRVAHEMLDVLVRYLINDNKHLTAVTIVESDNQIREVLDESLMKMFTKHAGQ
jgi:O-acetyl-ADP-ribose deacetylase (regulator of RNase III)